MSAAKKPNTASQHTAEISSSVVLLMESQGFRYRVCQGNVINGHPFPPRRVFYLRHSNNSAISTAAMTAATSTSKTNVDQDMIDRQ